MKIIPSRLVGFGGNHYICNEIKNGGYYGKGNMTVGGITQFERNERQVRNLQNSLISVDRMSLSTSAREKRDAYVDALEKYKKALIERQDPDAKRFKLDVDAEKANVDRAKSAYNQALKLDKKKKR